MSEKKQTAGANIDSQNDYSISYLLGMFTDHRYVIIAITLLSAIISIVYTQLVTPVYRADVLIQVEKNKDDELISSFSAVFQQQDNVKDEAELALLQSRRVIGKTASDLRLDINVKEKKIPFIGDVMSKSSDDTNSITIEMLNVPEDMLDIPFELTIESKYKYKITTKSIGSFYGNFGEVLHKNGISLLVKNITPKIGASYIITKRSALNTINDILSNIDIVSSSRDTGVLRVRYTGTNKKIVQATLNKIAEHYMQQNIKVKSEQVDKGLKFLSKLLPIKKEELAKAEDELNQYRIENKSLDLTLEAQQLLKQGVMFDTQLNALTIQEMDISQGFTQEYPSYRALLEKKETIINEREKINISISNMPKIQQKLIQLTRNVMVGQDAYVALLKKQQELKVNRAGIIGDVRILDYAEIESQPIKPMTKVIVFTSVCMGFFFSLLLILLKSLIYKRIEKIEDLNRLNVEIYATIPFAEEQKNFIQRRKIKKQEKEERKYILSEVNPAALAIEAIRNLRTSLHFAMMDAANNILMISGTSPGVGKSFVSINLANLIAKSGKKVLLVDADMRKGYLHELFGASVDSDKGLSSLLQGKKFELSSYIHHDDMTGLDYIPRGRIVNNPSELLMQPQFQLYINEISREYDFVIIDTPPILAVTDPAIVGMIAGTSLLVVGFAKNSVGEIAASISRFEKSGIKVNGLIVNGYVKKAVDYYASGSHYNYGYK